MSESDPIVDELRDRLVLASLDHIPFDGWTMKALRHGAADLGLDPMEAEREFPTGVVGAVDHFTRLADRLMVEDMLARDVSALPLQARIAMAIRLRLERWGPHREAVRRACAVYALPQNMGRAAQATWRTVDAVWKAAGDRSHDFNWYTKRGSLAAVYTATVFYWLDDRSDGFVETWDFLDRRLADTVNLIMARKRVTDRLMRFPNPVEFLSRLRMPAEFRHRRR